MFNAQPFRLTPAGPAHAYETFQIRTPRGPEYQRPATCEEVNCEHWLHGWATRIPVTSVNLLDAARNSGRRYTEYPPGASDVQLGGETVTVVSTEYLFVFPPGTPCFRASTHRVNVRPDLPQLFVVRGGDWRGNPTGAQRIHQRPDDWVENLQESTESLRTAIERG